MSPKSILQFLAVCGSAKVVEAFATAPERFGGSVKVEVKQESSQIGGTQRCPCYNTQDCTFRGVGLVLDPNDADIATKTNTCWENCYKDPNLSSDGTMATNWALCQGGAEQWRTDACSAPYSLDRVTGSVFEGGGAICNVGNNLQNENLCTELQAVKNPYRILHGKSCQLTMEESAQVGKIRAFCNSLHLVVDNGFQDAYRCEYYRQPSGKHKCVPSGRNGGLNAPTTPICYNVTYQQVHGSGSTAPNTYGCDPDRVCVLGEKFYRTPIYRRAAGTDVVG